MNWKKTLVASSLLAGTLVIGDVILLDFGTSTSPLFTGTYDGSTGFIAANAPVGGGLSVQMDVNLGAGRTLSIFNVGSFDNSPGSDPSDPFETLLGDKLISAGFGADDPVIFTFTGFNIGDSILLELNAQFGTGGSLVTWGGGSTPVSGAAGITNFVSVGTALADGAGEASGNFTGPLGSGEGSLAAARITVTTAAVPEPMTAVLFVAGLGVLGAVRRFSQAV